MLLDHDNLLSTFGKDSQSSNRKNSEVKQCVIKSKRTCLNYENDNIVGMMGQQKNKYEQILSQRKKTHMMLQKNPILFNEKIFVNKSISSNNNNNGTHNKQSSKKLRTQSDIDVLNNKIRKSISSIAETICKSKITLHNNSHKQQSTKKPNNNTVTSNNNRTSQSTKKLTNPTLTNIPARIQSHKQFQSLSHIKIQNRLKSSRSIRNNNNSEKDKQNMINFINKKYQHFSKKSQCDKKKQGIIRNESTKKKGRFFQSITKNDNTTQTDYPIIKSSFSIDLNSQHRQPFTNNNSSQRQQQQRHKRQQSMRVHTQTIYSNSNNHCSNFQLSNYNNKFNTNGYNQKVLLSSNRDSHQQCRQSLSKFNRINVIVGNSYNKKQLKQNKYNENTLKKQVNINNNNNKLVDSDCSINRMRLIKLQNINHNNNISNNNINSNKFTTKTTAVSSTSGRQSARQHQFNTLSVNNNDINKNTLNHFNKNYHNNNKQFIFYYHQDTTNKENHQNNNNNYYQQKQQQQSNYSSQQQEQKQQNQQKQFHNSPNFNNIQVPKKLSLYDIKKNITLQKQQNQSSKKHPLINALMQQIQLDYDLRHAKHMFSGIEQPFTTRGQSSSQSTIKWHLLNQQLITRGLHYPINTIKTIFLPTQQQLDPFLSVTQPHDQLIHSLIYAYQTAQIHWQQTIYKKWQHWDLRDIQLTIQNVDRQRKGCITVEDLAAFVSIQSANQYKNRDLVLIYKRLLMTGSFVQGNKGNDDKIINGGAEIQKSKLKFRSLINSLIKNF